jgi:CBS domain-containing protein/Zn-dependent protease
MLVLGAMGVTSLFEKDPAWMPTYLLLAFAGVLLHDLVKLVAARFQGGRPAELIVLPFGGQISFEEPPSANAEVISNALGILVFFALSALAGYVSGLRHEPGVTPLHAEQAVTLLQCLRNSFLLLALVNLIPAFPLDGGFVVRALLTPHTSERRATASVGAISQALSFGLFISGILAMQPLLLVAALAVFLSSAQQVTTVGARALLQGRRVQDAMQTNFATLQSGEVLETAAQQMIAGAQHDFPVVAGQEVIGVLTRSDLARGIAKDGPYGYVAGQMNREFSRILPDAELEEAAKMLNEAAGGLLLVMQGDELVGLLSREKFNEYLMLLRARWVSNRRGPSPDA